MVLLISYDLNRYERPSAYAKVRDMIERHAISHTKPLYSQWFVQTQDGVDTWDARMKSVTDADDRWFICRVQRPYQGWLDKAVWPWLNERV